MNPLANSDPVDELSENEVSVISQMMGFEDTRIEVHNVSPDKLNAMHDHSSGRAGLFFLIDVMAFYTISSLIQAILDIEDLQTNFLSQFLHYSIAFFWMNLSFAMAVVAVCIVENITFRPTRMLGAL